VSDVSRLLNTWTTASAVKQGLLPPVKPVLYLHIRDTVVCLGGDGNHYLTGDKIWAFNGLSQIMLQARTQLGPINRSHRNIGRIAARHRYGADSENQPAISSAITQPVEPRESKR
jgi:hypothetical protein